MQRVNIFESLDIGGVKQWVRIRSRDSQLPVLLILYGGPGLPLFPRIADFGERAGLEELFTVVYWEQRGAGKSYSSAIPPASMTIDRFVDDIRELCDLLRTRFDKEKIYLLGDSWGTVIGLRAAAESPERFHAYVGTGQVINVLEGYRQSYQFTLREARHREHRKAIRELKALGPPPYTPSEIVRQRKWVGRFGGARRDTDPPTIRTMLVELLTTPEYRWSDVWKVALHPFFCLKHLLDELFRVDFVEQAPRLELPVYFLEGRHDYMTPTAVARPYFERVDAPHKEWIWFEDSAHFTYLEEPNYFRKTMRAVVQGTVSAA